MFVHRLSRFADNTAYPYSQAKEIEDADEDAADGPGDMEGF